MRLVVAAVIGGDDDQGFLAQTVGIEGCQNRPDGFIGVLDHADILRGHPAVNMAHRIGGGKVDKKNAKIHRKFFGQALGQDCIAVVDIAENIEAFGFGNLA